MAGDESGTTLGQPHLSKQDLSTLVSDIITICRGLYFTFGGIWSVLLSNWFKKRPVSTLTVAGAGVLPPGT